MQLDIGSYRPIYLWGGPGTVRMNRLKFVDVPVDELAHHQVHTPQGADLVVNAVRCNWVHLMYDWGFPPEVEREDWDAFKGAASVYHDAGTPVFAYIQTSNCVYDGTFRHRDWYATDPRGNRIAYLVYSRRAMTCLSHPDWRQHLKDLIKGAIQRGADGIFFDNLFYGDQPLSLFGTWLGSTGCHCSRCQQQYLRETGRPIPAAIQPSSPEYARYLRWRANQVTQLIAELATYARELRPGTLVSANDFDAILRNAYLVHGIDLQALAHVQDITMIENYGLPRWESRPKPRLANNALNVRTARSIVGTAAHLSMLSYDVGIGFDPVYPPRRYQQGIAEAAACGASMTTKGTEYYDGQRMTVLTASEYAPIHAIIGEYHAWLEANARLYNPDRQNVAPVGLLCPGEALWLDWHRIAPLYFGVGQALTVEGIPWRVVQPGESLAELQVLLVFDNAGLPSATRNTPVISVPDLPFWHPPRPSVVDRSPFLRRAFTFVGRTGLHAYSQSKLIRRVLDGLSLPKATTQSPLYHIPPQRARSALLDALPPNLYPRLRSQAPCLIEVWRDQDRLQIHLVNYATAPQKVLVRLESPATGHVLSPDEEEDNTVRGAQIDIPLDVYGILLITLSSA